jgi:hypothetical protein
LKRGRKRSHPKPPFYTVFLYDIFFFKYTTHPTLPYI